MSSWISLYKFKSIKHFTVVFIVAMRIMQRWDIQFVAFILSHEIKFIEKKEIALPFGRRGRIEIDVERNIIFNPHAIRFSHAISDGHEENSHPKFKLCRTSEILTPLFYDIEKGSRNLSSWMILHSVYVLFKRTFLSTVMTHRIKNIKFKVAQ